MVVALVVFVALNREVVGGLGDVRLVGVLAEVDSRVVVLGLGEAPDKLEAVEGRLGVRLAALVGVIAGSVFFSAMGDLVVAAGDALLAVVREAAVGVIRDANEGDAIFVGVALVEVAFGLTPSVFGVLDFAAIAAGFFAPGLAAAAAVNATAAPATTPRVATIATSVSNGLSDF